MNVTVIEKPGYEADDVLGTLATQAEKEGYKVSLVSGDRDMLQLASDNIKIRIPKTKATGTEIEDYLAIDVLEKYNVTPKQFIDLKGLMGDTSDNIPGIPGVGEKTATKLITEYKSIENLYEHIDKLAPGKVTTKIKDSRDLAYLSKKLATICTDCELEFKPQDVVLGDLYNEEVYRWFKNLEFKSLLSKFQNMEIDNSLEIEKYFETVEDLAEADKVFDMIRLTGDQLIGLSMIIDQDELLGISLCFSEKKIFVVLRTGMITEHYIVDRDFSLVKNNVPIDVIGLKNLLVF